MTIGALVSELATLLEAGAIPEARTEARDLIAAVANEPRFWPNLHATAPAPGPIASRARAAVLHRVRGAPFAYAVGRAAFRHLTLDVDERVLIPRQETELLVDLVLEATRAGPGGMVVDVGTGYGAIALALAAEGRFDRVIATDVDSGALTVARRNAQALRNVLRCAVEFRSGSAIAPLVGERVDVLVSNPPYIAFAEASDLPNPVRDWEPTAALLSGAGGLAVTAEIVRGAPSVLRSGGLLALEVDSRRAALVARLVGDTQAFGEVQVRRDLAGRDRFVLATCRRPAPDSPLRMLS